jgi:hypothetical protein
VLLVSEKETFEGPAMRVVAMMEEGRLETGVANGLLARELPVFGRTKSDGLLSVEILLLVSDMASEGTKATWG